MGNILSCCPHSNHDDEESLLRGRQNGMPNTTESYDAIQQQMLQQQRKIQQRENELREIVSNTNDKLIDISMISNSGIVIQSGDFYSEDNENEDATTMNVDHNSDNEAGDENNEDGADRTEDVNNYMKKSKLIDEPTLTVLTDKEITIDLQQQIRQLHKNILQDIKEQITITTPQKLTMEF